jgi:carnosine N-methyltransferase
MSCCNHSHHDEGGHDAPSAEDLAEMRHFAEIVDSFANYRIDSLASLSDVDDASTREAIDVNSSFTEKIAASSEGFFGPSPVTCTEPTPTAPRNISKVRSTLKQFVREWSVEGADEREASFSPLVKALVRHLPIVPGASARPFVVCPGSGLGRLPYEIAKAGYDAQGNEFSYHMILGSYLLLNTPDIATREAIPLYPFALNFSNSVSDESRLRCVRVPDEVPSRTRGQMSMCAGEFVEVYERQGVGFADGVVTCFFIDTAKNIMLYIRTIAGMLREGGVWANLGPLLFHYAEQDDAISIELSWQEIRLLMQKYFDIIEEDYPRKCIYSGNRESLRSTEYDCVYFVARRNTRELEGFSNPVF